MSDNNSTPESSGSDDPKTNPGEPDGKQTDANTKDDLVSRAELLDAIKKRDSLSKKLRERDDAFEALQGQFGTLQKQLKDIQSAKHKEEEDLAAKQGNIEKLMESWKVKQADFEQQLAAKDDELKAAREEKDRSEREINGYLKKTEAFRMLSEFTTDPEVTYMLTEADLDLVTEDGRKVLKVKDSVMTVKEFVERKLEGNSRGYLLKTQRKAGSGAQATPNGSTTNGSAATSIPSDFGSWDKARRKEWMAKNPELARVAFQQAIGK